MRAWLIFVGLAILPLGAEIKRAESKGLLDREPGIIHLGDYFEEPLRLKVVKEAPVFSDKNGRNRRGLLPAGQTVVVEAITDRAYKIRGKGERYGISGWVGPFAFESEDPKLAENLKAFWKRQTQVEALIAEKEIAVGMTEREVERALGKPMKTTVKQTEKGASGKWEWLEVKETEHFRLVRDPISGAVYRQLSHVTQEEKSKTVVTFEGGLVSEFERSEQRRRGPAVVVVPPCEIHW